MAGKPATNVPPDAVKELVLSLADDELVLGHRDSEWTGYAPILEEDIAFSNIAQDEMGHSLVWFTLYERLTHRSPDAMGFERDWSDFRCCRLVTYPKGDFGYTVVRQYLFDAAEQIRLSSLMQSPVQELQEIAQRIIREENYHVLHSQGLVERLGDSTDESHGRMQKALDAAFPQALGMFEKLAMEEELVRSGVFPGNEVLKAEWLKHVVPVLARASLIAPVRSENGGFSTLARSDDGGRKGSHLDHLRQLVSDMQLVYRSIPGAQW